MGLTNFENGVASFGIPVLPGIPPTTGSVFFVHSGTGSNSLNLGGSPTQPLATIDYAINLCTAAKGDMIIVMPGHAETIASSTTLVPDVAGISIIGLGRGRNRPVLTFSATSSKIIVSAANIRISNLVFVAGISAVVIGLDVATGATDFQMDNCEFNFAATTHDFAIHVLLSTVTRATIDSCRFIAENTTGSNAIIQFNACVDLTISRCTFEGDCTTAVLNGVTAASTGVMLLHNFLRNSDTTAGILLTTFAATTGLAAYNSGGSLYATDILATWANTSILSVETYIVNVVTESAGIAPATRST